MKIVDIPQRTPEWHQWRNLGVSASEADIVLGLSPYKTRYRLYAEKKGLILPDNLDRNPHVQRGIRLEPVARRAFEGRHNTMLLPVCAESDGYPFIRASFDGIDDNGIPVEIKAPTEKNFRDAQSSEDQEAFLSEEDFRDVQQNRTESKLYKRYYFQIQQQILVANSDRAWLSLYLNEREYLDVPIPRDDAIINTIIFEARKFWECLKTNMPPERDPDRDIFIPSGLQLDQWNALASSYHHAEEMILDYKSKIKAFEQEQSHVESSILQLMGDFAHAESAGLRVSRYLQQGSIDYRAALKSLVPDHDPVLLEQFRKAPTERSRFTLKEEDKASVPYSIEDIMSSVKDDFWF
ncbi:MAG: YqaJ viral recombinase family protein [Methylicorpusculum sp.]|jgi:putative phage-type endonuclease|uniref:YqaJ viral recombinase family nuclease n=1 Tax=Methylicorpusculum TaxID=2713642 RepID=UPI00135C96BD|nr:MULTISPECIES: YqaJ viral recombinase family protein [Methylicorpusculum]MCD2452035.1 YqaJ viral recombinase family protein [Methylicorpusculum oleiharenae]MDP2203500.1 YqaJ viral recombinase family protein [Methylicorpusculum sp.]